MLKLIVTNLFDLINNNSINYNVLRGYEDLPDKVTNDIDFFVASSDIYEFYSCLLCVSKKFSGNLSITTIRQGIVKTEIVFEDGLKLKIDFWFELTFWGLIYADSNTVLSTKRLSENKQLYIPSNEIEFSVSFLKEMLHNQWVRSDKYMHLLSLVKGKDIIGLSTGRVLVNANQTLLNHGVKQYKVFFEALFSCFSFNLKTFGIKAVLSSILDFMIMKFSRKAQSDFIQTLYDKSYCICKQCDKLV